jgi:2-polyprenyl-6-hydroxyphenyl methylase/3-demethylubiquinone-9 3-methyltransferase
VTTAGATAASTVDAAAVARFAALADRWWDESGPFRALHRINPPRLAFIRDRVCRHFGVGGIRPLAGRAVLDIGCGGGLVAEPLARLGGSVVGLDAAAENVQAARRHAAAQALAIDYRNATAEELVAEGATFDLVVALEVVEHVADPDAFLESCAALVRPGGLIVLGTLNRTLKALLLAVVGAEYVLGWIPRGTHDWRRFIGPDALSAALRRRGLVPDGLAGLTYAPLRAEWRLSHDSGVNYLMSAVRPNG